MTALRRTQARAGWAGWTLAVASALAVATVLGAALLLVLVVLREGLGRLGPSFLFESPGPDLADGGIFPALVGTFVLTLLMTVAGVPVGVATGVYLAEYAPSGSHLANAVRAAVQSLAGVPSIVFGLFGLGFFVLFLGRGLDTVLGEPEPVWGRPAVLWSSMTLAVLTLPVVIVSTEEALRAVPEELRRAAAALGATRLQTVVRVAVPHAASGILTGVVLAIGRGAGEVAPIIFTGAANYLPYLPTDVRDMHMHLGYHVYALTTQSPDVDAARPAAFATVIVLLALTTALNAAAIILRSRARSRRV